MQLSLIECKKSVDKGAFLVHTVYMITTLRRDMVTDDSRYKIDKARKVYVYKNLHRNCYSVKQDGLVKMHTDSICLWDASFRVGQKGREKVLKEQRKNVHAGVTGYIDTDWDSHSSSPTNFRGVIYNPYSHKTFVCADVADRRKWTPVFHSQRVRLSHVNGKARIDAEALDQFLSDEFQKIL